MTTTVLAESRREGKTAVIERLRGESGYEYRVTVSERFSTLSKAQAAFLAVSPPTMTDYLKKQIRSATRSPLMR